MVALYVVLELACVVIAVVYGRIWRTADPATMDPKKIARFRSSACGATGLGLIIAVRLLTHTYG
jgi:hypothetical protein